MSVRYTRDALHDLDQISSYIAQHNTRAAAAVLEAVETVARRLGRFPYSAQATEMPGIRATPIARFPYVVFYSVEGSDVVIHYVRHASRLRPWESPKDENE
ncbi:MAG: type II toxin-antitoxin system RelE/ParE family toxin [Alphaproteobacteria bacterium]|nr:type II toxin-antitoxin system RelE/ParE family toxin [Alphaproteobacteria bacterium]